MKIDVKMIEKIMETAGIPGVSIAYVNAKGKISLKQLGHTDISKQHPVGAETIFLAASLTKALFAATMQKQ